MKYALRYQSTYSRHYLGANLKKKTLLVGVLLLGMVVSIGASAADQSQTRMLLLWEADGTAAPISQTAFQLFLGGLKEHDMVTVMRDVDALPLMRFGVKESKNAQKSAAQVIGSLGQPLELSARDVTARMAVAEQMFKQAPEKTLKALVLIPGVNSGVGEITDELVDALATRLTLNDIVLYAVVPEQVPASPLFDAARKTGGRVIYLSPRAGLDAALGLVYDSVQLRAVELGHAEALYDGDMECPEQEVLRVPVVLKEDLEKFSGAGTVVNYVLQGTALTLVLFVLVFMLLRERKLNAFLVQKAKEEKPKAGKSEEAPSFSKITIGLSRIKNSFAQTESKLQALSMDIEDFGSWNWEQQKNVATAYADLANQLFLIYDHLLLKSADERNDTEQMMAQKIERLLEDNRMEPIEPARGADIHSKFHTVVDEAAGDAPEGTVLKVVRRGYQRASGFVSDEPFVVRQAEVIVSNGDA